MFDALKSVLTWPTSGRKPQSWSCWNFDVWDMDYCIPDVKLEGDIDASNIFMYLFLQK